MPTPKRKRHLNLQKFHRRNNNGKGKPLRAGTKRLPSVPHLGASSLPSKPNIITEDIGKLRASFGLSEAICSILYAKGYYTVGALVKKLQSSDPKIPLIGSTRLWEIKDSLDLAGVRLD